MRAGFLGFIVCLLAVPGTLLADPIDPPAKPSEVKPTPLPDIVQLGGPEPIPLPKDATPPAQEASAPMTQAASAPTTYPSTATGPNLKDDHIGPFEHFWVHAGYLLWWEKKGPLAIPLLTTGTPVTFPNGIPTGGPTLDDPNTQILIGNSPFDYGRMSGVEFGGGAWLDCRHIWGVETNGFILERRTVTANFSSDANGNPVLGRPFNDIIPIPFTGSLAPDAALVSNPGDASGSFALSTSSRLWGLEANALRNLYATDRFRADLVLGFRYLDLQEDLQLLQQTTQLFGSSAALSFPDATGMPAFQPDGTTLTIVDSFRTRNQVYAGQIGMRFEGHFGNAIVGLTSKVGFGPNHETVNINGSSTAVQPGMAPQTVSGGLLALAGTNIGRTSNNWFVIVPQVNAKVGYQFTDWLQFFVAYDFLYINDVARPGSQPNMNLNSALLPTSRNFGTTAIGSNQPIGPNQPSPVIRHDDFWAQGIHFGVEFRY